MLYRGQNPLVGPRSQTEQRVGFHLVIQTRKAELEHLSDNGLGKTSGEFKGIHHIFWKGFQWLIFLTVKTLCYTSRYLTSATRVPSIKKSLLDCCPKDGQTSSSEEKNPRTLQFVQVGER